MYYPDILKEDIADWPAEERESCCAVCFRMEMELDLTGGSSICISLLSRSHLRKRCFKTPLIVSNVTQGAELCLRVVHSATDWPDQKIAVGQNLIAQERLR